MILKAKSKFFSVKPPDNEFRRFLYDIITHPLFEVFILIAILINTIIMAISYEGQTQEYYETTKMLNLIFSVIFIIECGLKITAYGPKVYFYDSWN